jgi:hypothetical protein
MEILKLDENRTRNRQTERLSIHIHFNRGSMHRMTGLAEGHPWDIPGTSNKISPNRQRCITLFVANFLLFTPNNNR